MGRPGAVQAARPAAAVLSVPKNAWLELIEGSRNAIHANPIPAAPPAQSCQARSSARRNTFRVIGAKSIVTEPSTNTVHNFKFWAPMSPFSGQINQIQVPTSALIASNA